MGTESRDPTTRNVFGDGDFSAKAALDLDKALE